MQLGILMEQFSPRACFCGVQVKTINGIVLVPCVSRGMPISTTPNFLRSARSVAFLRNTGELITRALCAR